MYLFTVIGHTGQGKSTWVRKFIQGTNQYVFDVNNEYKDLPDDRVLSSRMRNTDLDMKKFILNCSRLTNTNVVFEDATGFLRGRQSPEFSRLLVKKRHQQNNYILLFHSINRVPPEIMEMSNVIILFKTNDNPSQVQQKFDNPVLLKAFTELQQLPQYSYKQLKLI